MVFLRTSFHAIIIIYGIKFFLLILCCLLIVKLPIQYKFKNRFSYLIFAFTAK